MEKDYIYYSFYVKDHTGLTFMSIITSRRYESALKLIHQLKTVIDPHCQGVRTIICSVPQHHALLFFPQQPHILLPAH